MRFSSAFFRPIPFLPPTALAHCIAAAGASSSPPTGCVNTGGLTGGGWYGSEPSTSHPDYRTWIQSMIEDPLAEALLVGSFKAGDTVRVDRDEDSGLSIEAVGEKTPVEAA